MHLTTLTLSERERLAYIEGFTEAADLLGRLDDCHQSLAQALIDYDILTDETCHLRRRLESLGDIE